MDDRPYDVMVFDLDGVLYAANNGYMEHVRQNARRFIRDRYGVSDEEAGEIRAKAFELANQTVRGLRMLGYEVDQADFMDYCRSGEELYLREDAQVVEAVRALSERYGASGARGGNRAVGRSNPTSACVVFTNTAEKRARLALRCLGLDGAFDAVYGADFMGAETSKPSPEAFELVLTHLGVTDAGRAVMFEDSFKNLRAAKAAGMSTVFVKGETATREGVAFDDDECGVWDVADAVIDALTLRELRRAMPALLADWPDGQSPSR